MSKKPKKGYEGGFLSSEEVHFSWYLKELVELGVVENWEHEPRSFVLFDAVGFEYFKKKVLKTKVMEEVKSATLFREHVYTPDFKVKFTDKGNGYLHGLNPKCGVFVTDSENVAWVEVKPIFDQNNMTRLFGINQKWMYQVHGIYVNKVIPEKLFKATFTPRRYLFTDNTKNMLRKLKFEALDAGLYFTQE